MVKKIGLTPLGGAIFSLLLLTNGANAQNNKASTTADTIYYGGDILTMAGNAPQYVERLAVRDGKIVYAGPASGIDKYKAATTNVVNLKGKTLLPGFIDAHGHIVDYTIKLNVPDLSPPPVSDIRTIDDIIQKMKKHIATTPPQEGKVALGMGFDESILQEKRMPTRKDLDKISTTVPVLLVHTSGHLMAANSKAIELAGITRNTTAPPGGIIQKDATGEPNGIVEEQAGALFLKYVPFPTPEERLAQMDSVMHWYASYGITTAQDAISSPENIALLIKLRNSAAKPRIDIVSYPQWIYFNDYLSGKKTLNVEYVKPGFMASNEGRATVSNGHTPVAATIDKGVREKVGAYVNGVKFGGIKITGDGAPVAMTAYLTKPYLHPPKGQPATYRAYPTVQQPELNAWFDAAYKNNFQIVMHVNGDATADMMIAAVKQAQAKYGKKDLRPVSIHTQWVRRDQLDIYQKLGIVPSFFTSHTFYWGDWHINQTVGKERTFAMSAMNYANGRGMKFTNAADAPVVPPSILDLCWTAVNRVSRTGVVVGPAERVTPYIALKAVTVNAAYQNFEERTKGTLEAGKLADLVILEKNPLKVPPMTIKNIKILETIKDGKPIYRDGELKAAELRLMNRSTGILFAACCTDGK